MYFLWMIGALVLIAGVALLFQNLTKWNVGESFLLSACAVIVSMAAGGLAHNFMLGVYLVTGLAVIGYAGRIVWVVYGKKTHTKLKPFFGTPYFVALSVLFAGSLILFYKDFLQHIDEFHQWGNAVKYMTFHDAFPIGNDFTGDVGRRDLSTSLFHLFFQKMAGFSEASMYTSNFLLMWIGLLLPFGMYEKKDWKKVLAFIAIMFVSMYSLYAYSIKNVYVDIATIGWSAGLLGWWRTRTKKKTNAIIIAMSFLMLYTFKDMVGLLMIVFIVAFMVLQKFLVEREPLSKEAAHKWKKGICIAVLVCIVIGIVEICFSRSLLWKYIYAKDMTNPVFLDKVNKTVSAFSAALVGKPFARSSSLPICFPLFLLCLLVLARGCGDFYNERRQSRIYSWYIVGVAVVYTIVLFYAYCCIFPIVDSANASGSERYFSICMTTFFAFLLTWLLQQKKPLYSKVYQYCIVGILAVFSLGINREYVSRNTSWDHTRLTGYANIQTAKIEAKDIMQTIPKDKKVYFIDQNGKDAFARNVALYVMDNQVSRHLKTPWKFWKDGAKTRNKAMQSKTVMDFPQILRDGKYDYIWIYNTDTYLNHYISKISNLKKLSNYTLYQIVDNQSQKMKLKKVKTMKHIEETQKKTNSNSYIVY